MSLEDKNSSSLAEIQEGVVPDDGAEVKPEESKESEQDTSTESEAQMLNNKNFFDSDEKALYDEILDKLDIKKSQQGIENVQAEASSENSQYLAKVKEMQAAQVENTVRGDLAQDFEKIQRMIQGGLINSMQGQDLKRKVLKSAFDKLVQAEKIKRSLNIGEKLDKSDGFEEFSKNSPNFFDSDGRKEVLQYLKSNGASFGKDELSKISEIVRIVEKSAIDRYLQKSAHEKTLINSNESAKQRLTANAQKSSRSESLSRTFTREQIGKMSSAEFTKYEPFIMEQLKKGLIK